MAEPGAARQEPEPEDLELESRKAIRAARGYLDGFQTLERYEQELLRDDDVSEIPLTPEE